MRTRIVAGNWKMHLTVAQGRSLALDLRERLASLKEIQVVLCPPFTHLAAVGEALRGSAWGLGAQNCHWMAEGPYTGEVAARMLAEVGCSWVILGHSERRQHFGETDALINQKLAAALQAGLRVMFCLGESIEERRAGRTLEVVRGQLRKGLVGIPPGELEHIAIAYEPVWAIGTGLSATPLQAQEVHAFLRAELASMYSSEAALAMRILYGGSVKGGNAGELFAMPDIDGALVGGASLKVEEFVAICRAAQG